MLRASLSRLLDERVSRQPERARGRQPGSSRGGRGRGQGRSLSLEFREESPLRQGPDQLFSLGSQIARRRCRTHLRPVSFRNTCLPERVGGDRFSLGEAALRSTRPPPLPPRRVSLNLRAAAAARAATCRRMMIGRAGTGPPAPAASGEDWSSFVRCLHLTRS